MTKFGSAIALARAGLSRVNVGSIEGVRGKFQPANKRDDGEWLFFFSNWGPVVQESRLALKLWKGPFGPTCLTVAQLKLKKIKFDAKVVIDKTDFTSQTGLTSFITTKTILRMLFLSIQIWKIQQRKLVILLKAGEHRRTEVSTLQELCHEIKPNSATRTWPPH